LAGKLFGLAGEIVLGVIRRRYCYGCVPGVILNENPPRNESNGCVLTLETELVGICSSSPADALFFAGEDDWDDRDGRGRRSCVSAVTWNRSG